MQIPESYNLKNKKIPLYISVLAVLNIILFYFFLKDLPYEKGIVRVYIVSASTFGFLINLLTIYVSFKKCSIIELKL